MYAVKQIWRKTPNFFCRCLWDFCLEYPAKEFKAIKRLKKVLKKKLISEGSGILMYFINAM